MSGRHSGYWLLETLDQRLRVAYPLVDPTSRAHRHILAI